MFGIYPKSYDKLLSIFKQFENIDKVVIYGSRAKGNYREGSDIDFTIFGQVGYHDIIKLKNEFEDSFVPYFVDISIYDNLKSESLKNHITTVGKIFYKRISDKT